MKTDTRNTVASVAGEAIWGLQAAAVSSSTVLTVLLKSSGAGPQMIGALASIEMATTMIPQILGVWLFWARRRLKLNLVLWHIVAVSPWLLFMGIVALNRGVIGDTACRWLLLGFDACFYLALGVIISAWVDWQAHIFPVAMRGRVFGMIFCGSATAGTVGGLIAGWVIGVVHESLSYGLLYIGATVLSVVSVLCFMLVRDPAVDQPETGSRPDIRSVVCSFRATMTDPNFRSYMVGRILGVCGFPVVPFIALYFVSEQGGGLSEGTVVSCGAAMAAGMAVGNLLLGHLGDARGHRAGILVGYAAQVVSLVILLTMRGTAGCILAYLAAGFCLPGTWVSHTNIVIEACPHEDRVVHISAANMVMGLSGFGVPLVAGVVAGAWGLRLLFWVCVFFSVAALAWIILKVRDPRCARNV